MNGLTLRIVRGGTNKSKGQIGYPPVNITEHLRKSGVSNVQFVSFSEANSTDEQLAILKNIFDQHKDVNSEVMKFIVLVFLHADAKHPVKSFLTRYITRNNYLEESFTDTLSCEIQLLLSHVPSDYKQYINVVSKVFMCIENFNAGAAAVKLVETDLAAYLKKCLEYCIKLLSEDKTLAPTEKNEIFNLVHLSLRLLLHIIQKVNENNINRLVAMFSDLRICMRWLMITDDVPMDTKSVCGILYLYIHIVEYGSDHWIDILNPAGRNEALVSLLEDEASQLCLYSAVATVVTSDKLETNTVDGTPAIVVLLERIMDIGDRNSSDSTFILGVTRTVSQIGKMMERLTDKMTGLCVVDSVLVFTWSHLEHYMDSVRHLTAQILGEVVKYCARIDREGDNTALTRLQNALESVDRSGKGYFVGVRCLVSELGARRVLGIWPSLIPQMLDALDSQHVQASATATLETLLQNYAKSHDVEEFHKQWVQAITSHVEYQTLDSSVLNILEEMLRLSVKLDHRLLDYIIPYIKQSCESSNCPTGNLKCTLMLLSVVRHSGTNWSLSPPRGDQLWKGIISYQVLQRAAIDAVDETRILSLSLIVESPKTTEQFTSNDLSFVLYYLKYNINEQAPNFRQHTLSLMKKFLKRFEDSYKVIKRQNQPLDHYIRFAEDLREQCFSSLIPGANYSRRCVALQLLAWTGLLQLEGWHKTWKSDYVDKLLLHLEDSYENNKSLALQVLCDCPVDLLKCNSYSVSLDLEDIFAQASSLKPSDCVSAAYKLDLLRQKLPEYIREHHTCSAAQPVTYRLVSSLLACVRRDLRVATSSMVRAAREAPMYGALHCITHLVTTMPHQSISNDPLWTLLVEEIIDTCMAVNTAVSSVVNNSSPEGHLPMDMTGLVVNDDGNSGGVTLEDGRLVTAQMVLLCAWRSVKEVSLLLGALCLHLSVREELEEGGQGGGVLRAAQLRAVGEHLMWLLAETKHRGAFEQAYVGFTRLLTRLWRCRSAALHALPARWLGELGTLLGARSATRRSAGLPYIVQALVTTELQVNGRSSSLSACMSELLAVARGSPPGGHAAGGEARAHALNVLRALFRNSALHEGVAPHVGEGLVAALDGFDKDSWMERNSSTLLFGALVGRVFGAARSRDPRALHVRNKMTGRIFFLRYPLLYDYILKKLKEVRIDGETRVLRPSLYPVLLLLARLYPSSLEGTVSNLKLVAFIPHVVMCGASSVLKIRQLAAIAALPLISPHQYLGHIKNLFSMVRQNTPRNLCHGLLLQLVALLQHRPQQLEDLEQLQDCAPSTLWVLEQAAGTVPCYLIADEYIKIINLIFSSFPTLLEESTKEKVKLCLETLIFKCDIPRVTSGRDLCLASATYLYLILLDNDLGGTIELIEKGLRHASYEVVLSTLNYILILYGDYDEQKCMFLEHLSLLVNERILTVLRHRDNYLPSLSNILKHEYLECQQKSLKLLALFGDTQEIIVEAKCGEVSRDRLVEELMVCVRTGHENLTHIYLESLLNLVTTELEVSGDVNQLVDVIRLVFECSSSDNSESTRTVVAGFIEKNIARLIDFDTCRLSEEDIFEVRATTWCSVVTLLEDDEPRLRGRLGGALASLPPAPPGGQGGALGSLPPGGQGGCPPAGAACAELLLARLCCARHAAGLLLAAALLDFSCVVLTDDDNDECRVFDQNEKYNIYLEETIWTSRCADSIICHMGAGTDRLLDLVCSLVEHQVYKRALGNLCGDNLVMFKRMIAGQNIPKSEVVNPKIDLFIKKLRG